MGCGFHGLAMKFKKGSDYEDTNDEFGNDRRFADDGRVHHRS